MSDSRSPGVCPWNPGEACKVGIGACLPPRKRLLAGLKQSGWFSSSSSYLQSCNGASCAGLMEELKLEVDLAEANLESNGDTCLVESAVCKQGECNAVESSVSLKSKKASRRRKSLSVLADCHGSVNKLQSEALPGGKIEKKFRTNKASMKGVVTSNGVKESDLSSREMVDAARAAAAIAAKAAAEARAIALDKAQVAAKAAAVAKAALEALAHVAYDDEEWGSQSGKNVRKHKRKGDKLNKELSPLLHTEGLNLLSEKREKEERVHVCSVPLDNGMEVVQTRISHDALSPVGVGAGRDKDKRTESHQFLIVDLASAPSDKIKEDEQAHLDHVYPAAYPPPPPLDDEKFARQLHRVMNSSPRISRNQAPLENSKQLEMAPFSNQGCIQNKYPRVGGCNLSREKKPVYKVKTRVLRTSIGRADVKVKSMSAINETLNMLRASSSQVHVLDGMVSCAASDANNICVKEDLSMPTISTRAFVSLTKSNEEVDKGGSASSCELDVEARSKKASVSSYLNEPDAVGADAELRAVKWAETIKKQKSSSKLRTGGSLLAASPGSSQLSLQRRDGNGIAEMPTINGKNPPATFSNVASDASSSHFETSRDYDHVAIDENEGRVNVSGLGATPHEAGDSVEEMSTARETQENAFRDKSSRATRKSSPVSSHGERHTRRQKVLGVLANGLSKGNQNFGGNLNLSSYMPSPTVS